MAQYRIPVEETFSWQRPVISAENDPPGSPVKGDRYLVGNSPTGDFVGHEGDVAWFDGADWKFDSPTDGWCTYRSDQKRFFVFDSTAWTLLETGLGDMLKSTYDTDDDGIVDKAETLDDGVGNVVTAAQALAAVNASHGHSNKVTLDAIEEAFTTALKTAYDAAVAASHTHLNKAILDAIEEAFTSALKTNYDLAYSRMGSWDAELGAIIMNI